MLRNTLWQGINSSFYPIPLIRWRSLSLTAKWLSSLLFHPCFPSHPPHWGMSQRIWHLGGEGGEQYRRETNWERNGAEMKTAGGKSWSISQRNLRRCGLALLPWCTRKHCLKNGNYCKSIRAQMVHELLAALYRILTVKMMISVQWNDIVHSITTLKLAAGVCCLVHNSIIHIELKLHYISSSTNWAQTQK